jgi:uncharacterized repeat protein (TIGR01451 family)
MTHPLAKYSAFALTILTLGLLLANTASAQASLSIGLTVSPLSEEDADGRLTYTAVVSNSGSSPAQGVVLTFTMPYIFLPVSSTPRSCVFTYNGPLFATCSLGDIAPGAMATAIAVVYPTNVGNLFVNADAKDSGTETATAQVGSTLTGVGIADVLVQLTATPNPAYRGSAFTYGMTAYNIGDDDARSVVVTLVLPPTVTFVSAPPACTFATPLVSCNVGHMAVSETRAFNIKVRPTRSGWTFATALLRGESVADPSALNDSATSRIWVNP